jgi:hypothetical protein
MRVRGPPLPAGMDSTRRTPAEADEATARVHAAHDTLTAVVEGLQSGADWQRALATAARLHRYSSGARGVRST